MREAQLNETVPYCVAFHCSVSKETVTRSIQEELKVVQRGWLFPASGSEEASEEQGTFVLARCVKNHLSCKLILFTHSILPGFGGSG